jgi:glycosyltransferase involved in cell wall biosynthesis
MSRSNGHAAPPSVVYVLPDKMGGVMSLVANLLGFRQPDGLRYGVVLTHNRLSADTRFAQPLPADRQVTVEYTLPLENLHAVLRRLARAIAPGPGIVVANDLLELATVCRHDLGRTVIHVLHGDDDYYYDLATRHDAVVDVYVAISRAIHDGLRRRLPHRAESIVYVPFGVPVAETVRAAAPGPLRLIFAGRLENGQKGIFDLPAIDRHLRDAGVDVRWTIVGGGPDERQLRSMWGEQPHVQWLGPRSNAEVVSLYAAHDVFVLPTRTEGLPVALLEAMGAGLVPVVSDIPSGVPEIVGDYVGLRVPVGDTHGFARAIAALATQRDRLEAMSQAARQVVIDRFDIRRRVGDYQALFARCSALARRRRAPRALPYGSRLDQPWLPNAAVYTARAAQRWFRTQRRS